MTYLSEKSRIICRSKDNRQEKDFDAVEWFAAMTSHISFKIALPYYAYFI